MSCLIESGAVRDTAIPEPWKENAELQPKGGNKYPQSPSPPNRRSAGVFPCLKLTGGQWGNTITNGGSELGETGSSWHISRTRQDRE